MLRTRLALAAESVVRDAPTNAVSIFNLLEEISAPAFPIGINRIAALFLIERDKTDQPRYDGTVVIRLREQELARFIAAVDFEDKILTRTIIVVQGLIVPSPGELQIELLIGDTSMGKWTTLCRTTGPQSQVLAG